MNPGTEWFRLKIRFRTIRSQIDLKRFSNQNQSEWIRGRKYLLWINPSLHWFGFIRIEVSDWIILNRIDFQHSGISWDRYDSLALGFKPDNGGFQFRNHIPGVSFGLKPNPSESDSFRAILKSFSEPILKALWIPFYTNRLKSIRNYLRKFETLIVMNPRPEWFGLQIRLGLIHYQIDLKLIFNEN